MLAALAAEPTGPAAAELTAAGLEDLLDERGRAVIRQLLQDLHVVVPARPGFPFALPLKEPVSATQIAVMVADAMAELGYDRYVVSGGDVGGTVAEIMAAGYPERVTALHLTNLSAARAAMADPASLTADALAYLGQVGQWRRTEAGFVAEQSTRPSTLMASLGDSPAGLLAWIGEKLIDWSDPVDGERAFSPDDLLTWISAYWFTDTIGTSFSTYVQPARLPARIETPTALSVFAHDIMPAPRSWAEAFANVADFIEHESGGHFAAWERPRDYADDVRHAAEVKRGAASSGSRGWKSDRRPGSDFSSGL
jgi:pimeloyl-ACP methyl ester carboxylesterase